jgi:hypothetical protein
MGEPQVIAMLRDVVRELVGEAESEAARIASPIDEIHARELGLFAAVPGERRESQRLGGADEAGAVALVEPLGLRTRAAASGFPAFEPHAEHAHGVRHVLPGRLPVHSVAHLCGAEMGQAGAAQHQMGGVGMVDRRQQASLRFGRFEIDAFVGHTPPSALLERRRLLQRRVGELVDRGDAVDAPHIVLQTCCDTAGPIGHPELHQAHSVFRRQPAR